MAHSSTHSHAVARISLPARFDHMASLNWRIPFVRLLNRDDISHLVVDLSQLDYIDTVGIGTLMAWDKACRADGKSLVLDRCQSSIASLIRLTGAHRHLTFAVANA